VFDRPYSFLFACPDNNELYKKKNDRILIKGRHAKAEEVEEPKKAEESADEEGKKVAKHSPIHQSQGQRGSVTQAEAGAETEVLP
jgi:hypothetical protein